MSQNELIIAFAIFVGLLVLIDLYLGWRDHK